MLQTSQSDFEAALARRARSVEAELDLILTAIPQSGEIARPENLLAAMRHAVLNGGKRLRPFLVLESSALFAAKPVAALRIAAALECIHCYSLVHDDLPAMDDDDLRRGQPTVHKAFDEATAILAGDSLLTLAFEIIASSATELSDGAKVNLILALSRAAGIGGMAGGQALDLAAEQNAPDEEGIIRLQAMKTGALIRFACEAGAIAGNAANADRERMAEFGSAIGLAFQLADDLLDLTSDAETMGKATGKDQQAGKATLASLHGPEWARAQLRGLVRQAEDLLVPYGDAGNLLRAAARFVAERSN